MGLVLPQTVKVKWHSTTKQHYTDKGYKFSKMGNEFEVNVKDLTKRSGVKIQCVCDNCGQKIKLSYNNYMNTTKDNKEQYFCKNCRGVKIKQICLEKYGVDNPSKLQKTKDKIKQTCKEHFGVESYSQTQDFKNKIKQNWENKTSLELQEIANKKKQTCKERFGVESYSQTQDFKNEIKQNWENKTSLELQEIANKKKQTCKEHFGVEFAFQSQLVRNKIKQTCLKKYGVDNPSKNEKIKAKQFKTHMERYGRVFKRRYITISNQQKHIHNLIGGECNYLFHGFFPDIAFVKDKIVVEYDGTGHALKVKRGNMTQEEFNQRELNKENKLFEEGWKIIRLVNEKTDKLPDDETIVNLINEKIHILKTTDTKKVVVKWS